MDHARPANKRESGTHAYIYAKYPVPLRALAISLKKQGANALGVVATGTPSTNATGRLGSGL